MTDAEQLQNIKRVLDNYFNRKSWDLIYKHIRSNKSDLQKEKERSDLLRHTLLTISEIFFADKGDT